MAYCTLEPFGFWNDWHQTGKIAHTIYSMNRSSTSPDLTVLDFMPKPAWEEKKEKAPEKQTADEQKDVLLAIYASAQRRGLTVDGA